MRTDFLFLYFIQKKGWLDDRRDYLYRHFQAHYQTDPDGAGFYSDFLFPLFVALSNEGAALPSLGDVPFLNGGLFEVDAGAALADQLTIGNAVFRQVFDDLLERYNFTVREDTPLDVEVAIDPEMLGQIFENLVLGLERGEAGRKATGSYYTPRVIVHFMCRQALVEFLAAESGLDPARIEALMDAGPAEQLTPEEVAGLGEMITEPEARLLRSLVAGGRVLDPAVGSGAFVVGMLYEMVALTKLLDVRLRGQKRVQRRNYDYDLKRAFIERNLYGVDVQPEAVRICELRLWLSLMVDYERRAGEAVPALPNLSYRVRVGDSLVERLFGEPVQLDQLADDTVARQLIDRIQTEKRGYFKEPNLWEKQRRELRILGLLCELTAWLVGAKRGAVLIKMSAEVPGLFDAFGEGLLTRRQLKAKQEAEAELARYDGLMEQAKAVYEQVHAMQSGELPAEARDVDALRTQLGLSFIWRLDFAEVFADKGGFDVVIANPPYVRQEQIRHQKQAFAQAYGSDSEYDVYGGRVDLYVYFYVRAFQLLHNHGVLCFISSDKFMSRGYGKKVRRFLANNLAICFLVDFGEKPVFDATVEPCVLIGRKFVRGVDKSHLLTFCEIESLEQIADLAQTIRQIAWKVPQKRLGLDEWILLRPKAASTVEFIRNQGIPLGQYVDGRIFCGIKTGRNRVFIIDEPTQQKLVNADPRSGEIIKKWLVGSDIEKWQVNWGGQYLIFTPHGIDMSRYPAVLDYLRDFKDTLLERATSSSHQWYELQQPQMGIYQFFESPKIVYQNVSRYYKFALDTYGHFPDMNVFVIPVGDLYLLGVLASSTMRFFAQALTGTKSGGFLVLKTMYVEQFPIPLCSDEKRRNIEHIVSQLVNGDSIDKDTMDLERQLDETVYSLFNLSPEQIEVIEDEIKTRARSGSGS
jgi:hypothetical protein